MINERKNKGITLVALVITIILLLFLAGITISQIIGNGLLEKAKFAKEKSDNVIENENEELYNYENTISKYIDNTRDFELLTKEELSEVINKVIDDKLKGASGSGLNPTGSIIAQMGNNAPSGYLLCDGAIYNINEYNILANYIKEEFGSYNYWGGDGIETFAVPNLQGEFLRGYSKDSTESKTSGVVTAEVGNHQDATKHVNVYGDTGASIVWQYNSNMSNADTIIYGRNRRWRSKDGNDAASTPSTYTSRPTNTSVLYCIKY